MLRNRYFASRTFCSAADWTLVVQSRTEREYYAVSSNLTSKKYADDQLGWTDERAHSSADCGAVRSQASSETPHHTTPHHIIHSHNHTINIRGTMGALGELSSIVL